MEIKLFLNLLRQDELVYRRLFKVIIDGNQTVREFTKTRRTGLKTVL